MYGSRVKWTNPVKGEAHSTMVTNFIFSLLPMNEEIKTKKKKFLGEKRKFPFFIVINEEIIH